MKVLLIGNGAREHAIAEKLARDCDLYTIMSKKNPAIAQLSREHWICNIEDPEEVKKVISGKSFDIGFSSPDATLAAGVSDVLAATGMAVASPSKAASRIEWDKGYMRSLMKKYGIGGSPNYELVKSQEDAARVLRDYEEVAVKPLGLTGGKGVRVTGDHFATVEESIEYANMLVKKDGVVLIEEKLVGEEFTLQAFCDGSRISIMPPVQDHKRAFEQDKGPNCYSSDTEILTDSGWKTFDKLGKKDRVMTYDKHGKSFQFQKPRKIYWMKHNGTMIHFKNRDVDLVVTPNHRMLLQQRKGRKKIYVVEAAEYKGENYILQSAKWNGRGKKWFILPRYRKHFKFNSMRLNFKSWIRFIGIFLAEGYVQLDGNSGRVYICQTKKSRHLSSIKEILDNLPFKFSYEENNSKFRINSIQLAVYLSQFGDSYQKYVPDYIKNADQKTIIEFLKAFCIGDGDIHHSKMRFHTASSALVGDLQEMFAKVGYNGIISIDKRTSMIDPLSGRRYKARPVFSIEMKKRARTSIGKGHMKEVRYNGYVGCVNVSTGFVLVRRNGRVAICGNTGSMGSYSTGKRLPFLSESDIEAAAKIMYDSVYALKKENAIFRGVLYGQFMATKTGPKVVEFNARFGDPEAINVLTLLEDQLSNILLSMADGQLTSAKFSDDCTVVKYLVPDGYPEKPIKDREVTIDSGNMESCGAKVYYASVYESNGKIFTTGSRSFGIVGRAETLEMAEQIAERGCKYIHGPVWHRKDIGTRTFVDTKVARMKKLKGGQI